MINDTQNIEDRKIKSEGSRPVTFLTVVFVLTLVAQIWFGWNAWSSYHTAKTDMEYQLKIGNLRHTIIHLDEVLTMSARMAAATGDLHWEKRYHSFEPKLDVAIKEAMKLAPEAHSAIDAADTDAANIRLVEMENHSFDLVRQGRIDEAKTLLFSDEYEKQKRIYSQGMTHFAVDLSVTASTRMKDEQRKAFLRVGIVFMLILLLTIVWFVALRIERSWKKTLVDKELLEKEIAERKRIEESLQESENKYRLLVESTPDWVWTCDVEGRQTFSNKAIEQILGYEVQEILGTSADNLMHSEDRKRNQKWFQKAKEQKRG